MKIKSWAVACLGTISPLCLLSYRVGAFVSLFLLAALENWLFQRPTSITYFCSASIISPL